MRSLLWIAAIAVPTFTACNYTVGECWPRGQGDGSAGVGGGGVIVPGGAGGLGDAPSESGTAGPACNSTPQSGDTETTPSTPEDDAPVETSLKIFCSKPDHGATCSELCLAKGIGCVPLAMHPYKPEGGIGKLFSCNDLFIGFMCGYHYANGDDCYYPFGTPFPKVCSYSGND
jgi:hypothetical protein